MSATDALMRRRKMMMGQDASSAPMMPAPMGDQQGLSQAYDQPMAPAAVQSSAPLMPNPQLESQALQTGTQIPMNPMIAEIAKRLGLMNMIRNRSNQQILAGS